MDELLAALGRRQNRRQKVWLVSLFAAATLFFLTAGHIGHIFVWWSTLLIHTVAWAVWFAWQGWLFPLNRERYLRNAPLNAYQKAFCRDILPGVSFGVSQMLRPVFYGFLVTSTFTSFPYQWFAAVLCGGLGLWLLYSGFKAIGISAAGFLYEYRGTPPPLVRRSIYAYIRHPLFLGGVLASFGASLFFDDIRPLGLALLNIAVLPVYGRLEDARLIRVFGGRYREYRSSVGGFVPRLGPKWFVMGPRRQRPT